MSWALEMLGDAYYAIGSTAVKDRWHAPATTTFVIDAAKGEYNRPVQPLESGMSASLKYYEESLAIQYERSCRHRPGARPTVAHLEKALRQREAKLGKTHPEVARTLGCLAYLFANETRYLEALQLQQRGVDIEKASLGTAHADVALSYYRMSLYKQRLSLLGQIEDAIWLMGKAEAAAAAALPMGHVWQRTFALRTARLKADLTARQAGATPEHWTTRSVPRYAWPPPPYSGRLRTANRICIYVYACVCVCVRACVRACVRVSLFVCDYCLSMDAGVTQVSGEGGIRTGVQK